MSTLVIIVIVLLIGGRADLLSNAFQLPVPPKVMMTTTRSSRTFIQSPFHRNMRGYPPKLGLSHPTTYCFHRQGRGDDNTSIRSQRSTTKLYSSALVSTATSTNSFLYLTLLALQFACQPLLTKAFTPPTIIRSTVVLAQDIVKVILSCTFLMLSGNWSLSTQKWTLTSSLLGAGIPSVLYLIQNYCTIMAYQNLPPVTFNVLNQTKTLSAALCCFLIMGKRQSSLQILSLMLLLTSALVIEKVIPVTPSSWQRRRRRRRRALNSQNQSNESNIIDESDEQPDSITLGVIPVLLASFISGLAGALCQKHLQHFGQNSYLFSMEISAISILFLLASVLLGSPDGKRLLRHRRQDDGTDGESGGGDGGGGGLESDGTVYSRISEGWTWKTWIPIFTQASGGIVVGLVTKHAGAVRKGFALIFGMLLSGILQTCFAKDKRVTKEQIVGGALAALSLWMHSQFPPLLPS